MRGPVLRRQSHDGDKQITWVKVALGERIFGKKGELWSLPQAAFFAVLRGFAAAFPDPLRRTDAKLL